MGKRILIATRTPEGLPGGSGFHLRNMIEVLEKNGHTVEIHRPFRGEYDAPMKDDDILVGGEFEPDVMIADYSWMCSAFPCFKNILKICFVHDLRCRIIPCLETIGYKDAQGWTEEKEAELLRRADILLVLNDEDKACCERMAPNCKIVRIGIAMEPVAHDPAKEVNGRCIYVGSDTMENRYATQWFMGEVWPKVLKEVPFATIDRIYGRVDDLESCYAQAQISVVPHIMKGGLKIKVAEAYQHGLLVAGNGCAYDGFENGPPAYKYRTLLDNPQTLGMAIIENLKFDDRTPFIHTAHSMCEKYMTPKAAYGDLLKVLIDE